MLYLTISGGACMTWLIVTVLFTPHVPYHIEGRIEATGRHARGADRDAVPAARQDVQSGDRAHGRRRPLWEKLIGTVAWILERQQ